MLVACGGHGPAAVAPTHTAEEVVTSFLQAVSDSNISKMTQLWGTAKGSAAVTGQPQDYEKRMVVTQLFLRTAKFKILSEEPVEGVSDQRRFQVQLDRGQCMRTLPMVTIKTSSGGWLVYQLDLNAAGNPLRPCDAEGTAQ